MPLSGLVLEVAREGLLLAEAGGEGLRTGQVAAAIAADIDDQAVAEGKVFDDLVEGTFADVVGEAADVEVADVVIEDAVLDCRGDMVVGAEVAALERVTEIGGIVLVPLPVAAVVEGGVEVHVAVAQFGEHAREHLEELVVGKVTFRAYIIYIINLLPVEAIDLLFVVEEAVMLVDDAPQGLEVSLCGVRVFLLVDARREGEEGEEGDEDVFHDILLIDDDADEEAMYIHMLLQIVNSGLLVVAQIADTDGDPLASTPVERQLLTEGGGADEGRRHDVVVVVPEGEDLIVRLSVVRAEHHASEWQVQFVARGEVLSPETEAVDGDTRRHCVQTHSGLGGVV